MSGFIVLLVFYGIMGLVTFCIYSADKSAAKLGKQRVRESTLHWLSLFCGWLGALLGQKLFRHKIQKRRFLAMFWLTVIVNIMAVSYIVYLLNFAEVR